MENIKTSEIIVGVCALIIGILMGSFFGGRDADDIARSERARSLFFIGSNDNPSVLTTDNRPVRVNTCKERENFQPCTARIEEIDGKPTPVDRKTGKPLPIISKQEIRYWKVGTGTCDEYWTVSGLIEVCY